MRLIVTLCAFKILSMFAFATFPTLIPALQSEWDLSNTSVGWISGIYFGGYIVAVATLTSLTDRIDAKRIYLICMALSAAAAAGFALTAEGLWSASFWRLLQGVGLAGTYMPGLKVLTDQIPARLQSRGTAFYTSSFGIGVGISYFLSGQVGDAMGWQWAFSVCALGPLVAFALAVFLLRPQPPPEDNKPATHLLDFRPVIANRRALGFTLAYSLHNAELFAYRSWLVAFLVFAQTQQAAGWNPLVSAAAIAAVLSFIGMPASVLGNESVTRFGRQRVVITVMICSAIVGAAVGFLVVAPYWLLVSVVVIYAIAIAADSAAMTAGVIEVAETRYKGATMAVHSVIGFVGAALGPLLFGMALDFGGGEKTAHAWGIAFLTMSLLVLLGPLAVIKLVGADEQLR
ncbi:MAG: MFS transporter [Gammaproteobacteria bacterium]